MKTAQPRYEILTDIKNIDFLSHIELAARICYKSEGNIEPGSAERLIRNLLKRKHDAMLEHGPNISVKFTANRGFTHEIVRMRLASFAQESTRYVNYSQDKWQNEITVCLPDYIVALGEETVHMFMDSWRNSQDAYMALINKGVSPQIARDVLPIGIKADIVVTSNIRHWRHMMNLRAADASGPAHPVMHEIMRPLCTEFKKYIPILFDDITWKEGE